jgi:histidyl-tRNA synthetase
MTRFQAPKGTYDVIPPTSYLWLAIKAALSAPAILAGYGYLETPTFEDTALFERGVGESTDVVSKEMYTFLDKGGRSLTLRPEGTAGVMRAIVENSLDRGTLPVKVWYTGPNFRYEQPQSGRYRQHTQVGVEAVGSEDPAIDAEVIWIAADGFRRLGLQQITLMLNSLGCKECRPIYREKLVAFLDGVDLDDETRRRAAINPLRVLDDKRPEVQAQLADAPLMADNLCEACQSHHDAVRAYLNDLGVPYVDSPRLVRGLDYYVRTTFEFVHSGLGAQSAIGGGGRYDGLLETLGGSDQPGIGFGLGVDRTLLAVRAEGLEPVDTRRVAVFAVALGAEAKALFVKTVAELRENGISADLAYGDRGLKGSMKAADKSGARFALVAGERDLAEGVVQLKDLESGDQRPIAVGDIVAAVVSELAK